MASISHAKFNSIEMNTSIVTSKNENVNQRKKINSVQKEIYLINICGIRPSVAVQWNVVVVNAIDPVVLLILIVHLLFGRCMLQVIKQKIYIYYTNTYINEENFL